MEILSKPLCFIIFLNIWTPLQHINRDVCSQQSLITAVSSSSLPELATLTINDSSKKNSINNIVREYNHKRHSNIESIDHKATAD